MTSHISESEDSTILYPTQSYLFTYSIISVFCTAWIIIIAIRMYFYNFDLWAGLFLISLLCICLFYSYVTALSRKLIVSENKIQNVWPFFLKTQIIYKKDIVDHRIISSFEFRGSQKQRIEFIGKNGEVFQTWNIDGFEKSEVKKIFI